MVHFDTTHPSGSIPSIPVPPRLASFPGAEIDLWASVPDGAAGGAAGANAGFFDDDEIDRYAEESAGEPAGQHTGVTSDHT